MCRIPTVLRKKSHLKYPENEQQVILHSTQNVLICIVELDAKYWVFTEFPIAFLHPFSPLGIFQLCNPHYDSLSVLLTLPIQNVSHPIFRSTILNALLVIIQKFCVLNVQSNTTIFHLVVQWENNYMFRPYRWAIFRL